jgi:hypothetical protein
MVYEHGGDIYRNKVRLDFSVNTNPLGMSENVKKAIAENIEQFGIYPDAMCVNLRNAIAEKERVGADNVICSNGAAEMIFAVVRAVMPKKTLLLAPTFSEYERALKSVGSQICYYYLKEENDFELQDDFIDYLDDINMVFICNPNNPVPHSAYNSHDFVRFFRDITARSSDCFTPFSVILIHRNNAVTDFCGNNRYIVIFLRNLVNNRNNVLAVSHQFFYKNMKNINRLCSQNTVIIGN